MNLQKQKRLVLLYVLRTLDGGGTKSHILQYIQDNEFWNKNDSNDQMVPTRREMRWRIDFAYVRHHLVTSGCIANLERDKWVITSKGIELCNQLLEDARNFEPSGETGLTLQFLDALYQQNFYQEETVDSFLLDTIINSENPSPIVSIQLVEGPLPKGEVIRRDGSKPVYRRDPVKSANMLMRAGHVCEVDPSHPSFLRRNATCWYMEPHHLIPMSMTEHFEVSLDREQNIFSLCSNCHNQIHYGTKEDVRSLLLLLFTKRENDISSILGRQITIEEIYQIYNVA